jgi:hypothetical protein
MENSFDMFEDEDLILDGDTTFLDEYVMDSKRPQGGNRSWSIANKKRPWRPTTLLSNYKFKYTDTVTKADKRYRCHGDL